MSPYQRGQLAASSSNRKNPYEYGTKEYKEWLSGFQRAALLTIRVSNKNANIKE